MRLQLTLETGMFARIGAWVQSHTRALVGTFIISSYTLMVVLTVANWAFHTTLMWQITALSAVTLVCAGIFLRHLAISWYRGRRAKHHIASVVGIVSMLGYFGILPLAVYYDLFALAVFGLLCYFVSFSSFAMFGESK